MSEHEVKSLLLSGCWPLAVRF